VTIDYVNLNDSISLRTSLREDDRLYIRTIPEWQLHRTVKVEGEVQFPGEYVMASRNETLGQLLKRCGGFTENAFPTGAVFERRSISRSLASLQIPKILENSRELVEDSSGHIERNQLMTYDSSMVNRIVINLKREADGRYTTGGLVLEPGDRIFIPPVPTGISVMGAVGATGTIKFTAHKKVKYYVQQAGDFTPRADKKGTRLIRANGAVLAGSDVLGKQAELGDVIVVPSKIDKERDWLKTMSTALAATTSLVTTVLLIDRL
jgi:polysaccharide export outer membrane protein